MSIQKVEIEAESLDEARKQIYNEQYIVLEEIVVHPVEVGIVESVGDTVKQAFIKARSRVPSKAIVKAENIVVVPDQITLKVFGDNEKSVGNNRAKIAKSVLLIKKGRTGFLGFGKTQNLYEIVITQPAVVEIRFKIPVKIRATIRDYSAAELLHSVQEAKNFNQAQTEEILQLLNPKKQPEIREKILKIDEICPGLVYEIIEDTCRKNERANWKDVIGDAHLMVLIRREKEIKEEKIRLRNLDVEIADSFHFFTSIDWNPKGHKEPTGLPKDEYGGHHFTDERFRRTIPNYSTDEKAFKELERRITAFGLFKFYEQSLFAENLNEENATLEQKCLAALTARKLARKKGFVVTAPSEPKIIARLRNELVGMCLGDEKKVDRLVDFERSRNPHFTEQQLYESAIERLIRDNSR